MPEELGKQEKAMSKKSTLTPPAATALVGAKEVTTVETELEVLRTISEQVQRLDRGARVRAMKYILDRFAIYIPSDNERATTFVPECLIRSLELRASLGEMLQQG